MKRKIIAILLCLCMIAALGGASAIGWDGSTATEFAGGKGTAEEPYLIETPQQLAFMAERVNAGDGAYNAAGYLLTADLNMSGVEFLNGTNWMPIGVDEANSFRGVFDGGGHVLSDLYCGNRDLKYAGFFGVIDGATVKNLTITGGVGGYSAAGIVNWSKNGTVINCCFSGWIDSRSPAGIVRINEGGLVANCCFNDYYQINSMTGGGAVIQQNLAGGRTVNCYATLGQSGFRCVAESSYENDGSTVENCYGQIDEYLDGKDYFGAYEHPGCATFTDEKSALTLVAEMGGEAPGQATVHSSKATLVDALNSWVDAQPSGVYKRWIQSPGTFPMLGDYTVTVSMDVGGTILPAANVLPVFAGTSKTVEIHSDDGYFISDVLADSVSVGVVGSYTFPAVSSNHTLEIRLAKVGSMDNFKSDRTYSGYSDVKESAWYGTEHEGSVRDATKLGLVAGANGAFFPDNGLRLGEAVKIAAIIHNIYRGGAYIFDQKAGSHWWDTYVDYAVQNNMLVKDEFPDFDLYATRTQMAYIFARALPQSELAQTSNLQAPDLSATGRYAVEVDALYRAGVLKGSDAEGTFHGDTGISRAEAAAIVVRLALPSTRFKNL